MNKKAIKHLKGLLENLKREKIGIMWSHAQTESLPIGISKYGGLPDVPDNFEWPMDKDGRPLSLLLQVNCTDIAALEKENLLPKSGMLYFFYQVSEQPWDNTTNGVCVLHFDVPTTELQRKCYPQNISESEEIPERAIQYKIHSSYPTYDDLMNITQDPQFLVDHWDEFDAAYEDLNKDYMLSEDFNIGFMLGYAELIQNAIVDDPEGNVLLLQLDSDEENDGGLMFGDCGSIYFYISKQNLINRQFDQITFELQCY